MKVMHENYKTDTKRDEQLIVTPESGKEKILNERLLRIHAGSDETRSNLLPLAMANESYNIPARTHHNLLRFIQFLLKSIHNVREDSQFN